MTKHPINTQAGGTRKRAVRIAIAAIACIPLIYGGALIWANQDPTHRLDKIPAAVVDLDQPVTQNGTTVDVGKTVAHDLVANHENDNFDWTETDASAARAGLKNGTYLATITLPKGMSSSAASLGGNAGDAADSRVTITTDDGRNYIVGVAAKTIGLTISQTASKSVSQQYLSQIYSGLDQISSELTTAANGAKQLASGAGTLKSGTAQLATGADQSASGAAQLASGLGTAQSGANQLASGTAQVAAGTSQLADQTAQAATGAQQLATGASQVAAGTSENQSRISQAASGAAQLAAANQKLAGGASTLATGANQVAAGNQKLADSASALNSAVKQLNAAGVSPAAIEAGLNQLSTNATQYVNDVNQLAESCSSLASSNDPALTQLCGQINQVVGPQNGSGYANSAAIAAAAKQLSSAAPTLVNVLNQATGGAQTLADDTQALATGAQQVASGASALSSGAQKAATGANTLSSGLASGESGAAQLNSGAQKVSSGASTLASGLKNGESGAAQLNAGAQQTAGGSQQLASKLTDASSGASDLATGTAQLASGAKSLDSGAGTLASGSGTLAGKLASGAKSVPSYSAADQKHLSDVASQPIALAQSKLNSVPSYGYGLSPYFLALGAWVGGLSIYMLLRAIPLSAVERNRPGWLAALLGYLRGAWISLVQIALLYLIVTLGIGVHPAHPVGLALFLGLAGVAFTAVNHALMVLFGSRGRFLGLILLVLQVAAAGATYPIQTTPAFFQFIHGLLPMTYAANAIRSLIAGGGAGVGQGIVVMVCWGAVSLLISIAVTTARRARRSAMLLPDFAV
ncbi:YhgE/Pip family protein [Gryllotalpicola reticulitermitis]|uniref:YhgE/Pip family protein n=1 Tax=Gryllotalpicola reticulitermitis TaxID=1184153 RepID=A0ABV8Q6R0_9MICO